jgi:hypothetical protein
VDTRTDEVRGDELYRRYCASCHGVEGNGDGPLAASLNQKPPDRTTLAKRNGCKFDEAAVMMTIDGRLLVAQHGPREMPIWGAIFAEQHVCKPFHARRAGAGGYDPEELGAREQPRPRRPPLKGSNAFCRF